MYLLMELTTNGFIERTWRRGERIVQAEAVLSTTYRSEEAFRSQFGSRAELEQAEIVVQRFSRY